MLEKIIFEQINFALACALELHWYFKLHFLKKKIE